MKKRLLSVLAAVALLLTSVGGATAHSTGSSHYYGDCVGGNQGSYGVVWKRTPAQIDGARMQVIAQALKPCTNPAAGESSKSFVIVTLVGQMNGVTQAAQLGLYKNQGIADQTYFGYTYNNNQAFAVATWVDFDNNGVMDTPIGGRSYTFQVYLVNLGYCCGPPIYDWAIRYRVTDDVTGATDYKDVWPSGGHYYGTVGYLINGYAWYGCEMGGTTASALGVQDNQPDVFIDAAGYHSQGVAWRYTQNSTLLWGNQAESVWLNLPAGFAKATQTQTGWSSTDKVACQTNSHS